MLVKRRGKKKSKEIGILSRGSLLTRCLLLLAFLQVEAGKGLEMRKLVLSGFLASEEIYINQLEALLLVSTWGRGVVAPCQPMSCFKTVLGVGEDPWRADTSVPLFATKHLENWVSHCLISVTVL